MQPANISLSRFGIHWELPVVKAILLAVASAAYAVLFLTLYDSVGAGLGAFVVLPMILAGWFFGTPGGLLAGFLAFPFNTILFNLVDGPGWDVIIRAGGLPGMLAAWLIAVGVGWLADMRVRLQVSLANRKHVEDEIIKRTGELATLYQISQSLSRLAEPSEMLGMIYGMIGQVLDNKNLYIALYDESQQQISFPVYTIDGERRPPLSRPFSNGLTEYVIRSKTTLYLPARATEALAERGIAMIGRPAHCLLAVPMMIGDEVLGVITLQDYERENVYTDNHAELLATIASQAAIALENARLYTSVRQERNLLHALLENVPDSIYFKDAESRFIRVSRALAHRLGLKDPAEATGKTVFDFIREEYAQPTHQDEQTVLRSGEPIIDKEEKETWADGTETWVLTSKLPLRDPDGRIIGTFGLSRDITERRRVEEAIRRQNAYLGALHETTLAMMNRLELTDLLHAIVVHAGQLLDTSHGYVYLVERNEAGVERLESKVGVGIFRNYVGINLGRGEGLSGKVWESGESLVVDDYSTWEGRSVAFSDESLRACIGVPLESGSQVIGVLGMVHVGNSRTFGPAEVEVLSQFAQLASLALDNARLFTAAQQELSERRRTEEALREAETRYRTLVEQLPAITYIVEYGDPNRTIYISPQVQSVLGYSPQEWINDQELWIKQLHADDRERVLAEVQLSDVAQNKPLSVEYRALARDGRVVWMRNLSAPMWDNAGRKHYRHGIMFDISNYKAMEDALREANDKLTQWLSELEQRAHEIGLVNEMGDLLQTCVDVNEAYAVISRVAQQLFPGAAGVLYVINASRNLLEPVAEWNIRVGAPEIQVFTPNDCWALRRGRMHVVQDSQTSLLCQHIDPELDSAYVCMPMMAQGDALGVLHLRCAPEGAGDATGSFSLFTGPQQQLIRTTADSVALALANLRLRETLRQQSIRDPLTGLFNRRYLEETLEREVQRAKRAQRPLGIIMVDIDHFKSFNDAFGHEAGDAVLRELGGFLRSHTRISDVACRIGGEEFVIVLPEASLEASQRRAQDLLEDAKRLRVNYQGQVLGAISLSAGVAGFPDHGDHSEAVLRAADLALFRAKREGRDRVVIG